MCARDLMAGSTRIPRRRRAPIRVETDYSHKGAGEQDKTSLDQMSRLHFSSDAELLSRCVFTGTWYRAIRA